MKNYIKFRAFMLNYFKHDGMKKHNGSLFDHFIRYQFSLVVKHAPRTTAEFHDATCVWMTTPEAW